MSSTTLATFRTRLKRKLLNRTDISDSDLDFWINDAYDHVSRPNVYRHREMNETQTIPLTATTTYALASDVDVVVSVFNDTQDYGLDPRDIEEFDRRNQTGTIRPTEYAIWETNLHLNGVPDSASVGDNLIVRYWQSITELSTDSSTTEIHRRFDEIIIAGAAWRGWDDLGNLERRDEAGDMFAKLMRETPQRESMTAKIGRGHRVRLRSSPIQRG